MLAALFPPDHPYHWPTIGEPADLAARRRSTTCARSSRATTIRRNASLAHRRRHRRRRGARAGRRATSARFRAGPPVAAGRRRRRRARRRARLVLEDRVELPRLYLAWPSPALFAPGDAELDLVGRRAGQRQDVAAVSAAGLRARGSRPRWRPSRTRASSAASSRSSRPRRPATRSTSSRRRSLDELARSADRRADRRRARARPRAGRGAVRLPAADGRRLRRQVRSAERLQRLSRRPGLLRRRPRALPASRRRRRCARPRGAGSIRRRRVALSVVPRGRARPGAARTPTPVRACRDGRSLRSAGRRRADARCAFRRSRAPCSPTACACGRWRTRPCRSSPRCSSFAAARRPIPRDSPGLAGSRPTCSTKAPARATRLQLADALARLGAQLDTEVGSDVDHVRLHDARSSLSAGAGARSPTSCGARDSPSADFARVRELRLSRLRQLSSSPSAVADRAFSARSSATIPTATARSARPQSLADDHARRGARVLARRDVVPADATLIVAGDLDHGSRRERGARGVRRRGRPSGPGAPPSPGPAVTPAAARADPCSSSIAAGRAAVGAAHRPRRAAARRRDYHALVMLNAVLGGQFISRINMNLREDKGNTYGAQTAFDFRRVAGPFACETSVQADAHGRRRSATCWPRCDAIRARGRRDRRRAGARKASLTRGYSAHFETAEQLVRAAAQLAPYDLPDDTSTASCRRSRRSARRTPRRPRRRICIRRAPSSVVVGDPDACRAAVEALGYPVTTVTPEF